MTTDIVTVEIVHAKKSRLWDDAYYTLVKQTEVSLGRTICGGRTRSSQDGAPCTMRPSKGRDRCRLHGGASPRGVDSPHFRNRGYAQDIPRRLAAKMERAMRDPNLSSLKSELALLDVRLGELMAQLPEEHTKATWTMVRKSIAQAKTALEDGVLEVEEVVEILEGGLNYLEVIRSDKETWKAITDTIGDRRRCAIEERKREVELEGTVTASQFNLVTGAMGLAVNEEVGECEWLTVEQRDELVARIGARFAQTLQYPILEADSDPTIDILDVDRGRHPLG